MPPKAAIHLNNDYKVATQKDREQGRDLDMLRTAYSARITKHFADDLETLDSGTLEKVREKMKRILERPFETGEEKHGAFKGFRAVKFEGQSFVLLFAVDKPKRIVSFARYDHHDLAYRNVPSIEERVVIPFEQWVLQRR